MGSDGAQGVAKIIERGAVCIVQAPDDCAVGSMPAAALAVSPRVRSARIDDLGPTVASHVGRLGYRG